MVAWEREDVEGRGTKKQEVSRIRAWLCVCRPARDAACVRRSGPEWHGPGGEDPVARRPKSRWQGGPVRSGEAAQFEVARRQKKYANRKKYSKCGGRVLCCSKHNTQCRVKMTHGAYRMQGVMIKSCNRVAFVAAVCGVSVSDAMLQQSVFDNGPGGSE